MKDLTCFEPKFKTLGGYIRGYEKPATPEDILKEISELTHIPIELIKSKSRKRELVEARHLYCKRSEILFSYISLVHIGQLVNMTNHASVIHARKNVDTIPTLRKKYQELYGQGI